MSWGVLCWRSAGTPGQAPRQRLVSWRLFCWEVFWGFAFGGPPLPLGPPRSGYVRFCHETSRDSAHRIAVRPDKKDRVCRQQTPGCFLVHTRGFCAWVMGVQQTCSSSKHGMHRESMPIARRLSCDVPVKTALETIPSGSVAALCSSLRARPLVLPMRLRLHWRSHHHGERSCCRGACRRLRHLGAMDEF